MYNNKNRIFLMALVSVLITLLLKVLVFNKLNLPHSILLDFIFTGICTIIIWEGNIQFDHYLNRKLPWLLNTKKRVVVQFLVAISISTSLIYLMMYGYGILICKDSPEHAILMKDALLICTLITAFVIITEFSIQFFNNWKNSLVEVEKYKTQSTQAQLENLKTQLNPHFMFNNMSVLSSLVYKDQDKAVMFINQLSKVYRYVLDNRNNELITVAEELQFLNAYIYLLEIRFETNIKFTIAIDDSLIQKWIPPMCLQILVENCIKHNEISNESPLHIQIISNEQNLEIINPLQLRINPEPSAKMGLQNIKERYQYLSDNKVEVITTAQYFKVILPLIHKL